MLPGSSKKPEQAGFPPIIFPKNNLHSRSTGPPRTTRPAKLFLRRPRMLRRQMIEERFLVVSLKIA